MARAERSRGALRDMRDEVDTGVGVKRIAGDRAKFVGTGDFYDYYDDLGLSTTAQGAAELRGAEAEYQGAMSDYTAKIDTAREQLGEYDPPEVDQSGYTTINVINGSNVEGSYTLPKEVAQQLWTTIEPAYYTNYDPETNTWYVDVQTKEGGQRGQELHEAFYEAQQQVQESVDWANAETEKLYKGQYAVAEGQINNAQAELDAQQAMHDELWANAQQTYQDRVAGLNEFFGG